LAIPEFQPFMLPLLRSAGDGKERSLVEARDFLAAEFKLADQELAEMPPTGYQARESGSEYERH
jgi:restriction endonuclease Mrr